MRVIQTHQGNPANDSIRIEVDEQVSAEGRPIKYHIFVKDQAGQWMPYTKLVFAYSIPPDKNNPNSETRSIGVTHEVLLAILIDRLECYQGDKFAWHEHGEALDKARESLMWLNFGIKQRTDRGKNIV
jgi:hypothetical protein